MSYVQTEQAVFRYGEQFVIPYTPVSDTAAGTVVVLGSTTPFAGVALHFLKANVLGGLAIRGGMSFLKEQGAAINVGDTVLWDNTQKLAFVTGGGYTDSVALGKCIEAALATDNTVMVSLIETAHTISG